MMVCLSDHTFKDPALRWEGNKGGEGRWGCWGIHLGPPNPLNMKVEGTLKILAYNPLKNEGNVGSRGIYSLLGTTISRPKSGTFESMISPFPKVGCGLVPRWNYSGSKVNPQQLLLLIVQLLLKPSSVVGISFCWNSYISFGWCLNRLVEGYPTVTLPASSQAGKITVQKWRFLDRKLADETTKMLYGGEDGMWGMEDAWVGWVPPPCGRCSSWGSWSLVPAKEGLRFGDLEVDSDLFGRDHRAAYTHEDYTWNLRIHPWKRKTIFQTPNHHCQVQNVNLRGCACSTNYSNALGVHPGFLGLQDFFFAHGSVQLLWYFPSRGPGFSSVNDEIPDFTACYRNDPERTG